MEDSGRDKPVVPGSAAADKNAETKGSNVEFHSASIDKKQKEEHFTNVEGAEERARAAEKAKEDAKRAEERAKDAAAKALKKEEETPLQKKARHKKYLIIAAICAVVIVPLSIFLGYKYHRSHLGIESAKEEAHALFLELRAAASSRNIDAINESKEKYLEAINKSSGNLKFYHIINYINFSATYKTGYDECAKYLEEAKSMIGNNEEMEKDYRDTECSVYSIYNLEKFASTCMEDDGGQNE